MHIYNCRFENMRVDFHSSDSFVGALCLVFCYIKEKSFWYCCVNQWFSTVQSAPRTTVIVADRLFTSLRKCEICA